MNISKVENIKTANTVDNVARQRALNLNKMGVKSVIELCVGPSLKTLEYYYNYNNINVIGNDIENRWKDYYPEGNWVIGDALSINCSEYDACVFAPPLSKGCSGNREDYLSIDEVTPSYYEFIKNKNNLSNIVVLVLPGKTLSIKEDKRQLHKLLNYLYSNEVNNFFIKEMKGNKNKITKYLDLYIKF